MNNLITRDHERAARIAIADPPYLGRAAGRGDRAAEYHPGAHEWDDPVKHIALMVTMADEYDGWAMAASGKTLAPLLGVAEKLGARLAIWHVTNAIPDGARVRSVWEAVFCRIPDGRRAVGAGHRVPDLLSVAHPVSGSVSSKPAAWTTWVLDLLGYQPGDEVDYLFPGSGAVTRAMEVLL